MSLRVPDSHAAIAIDHCDSTPQRDEDRFHEAVELVDLITANAHFLVHRVQLVVRRLELLVHRLELFIRGLQLLVRRLELLDRGLQLLVRGLQLFARGLRLLVRLVELLARLGEQLVELALLRDVDEVDAHAERPLAGVERHDLDVGAARRVVDVPGDVGEPHPVPIHVRLGDRRPELDRPVRDLQVLQQRRRASFCQPERRSCPLVRGDDIAVRIDEDCRYRRRVERRRLEHDRPIRDGLQQGEAVDRTFAAARRRDLSEDPPAAVDRFEEFAVRQHRLSLSEHEDATVVEREVKTFEDTRLRVGVEVHQHVARDENFET